MHTNGSSHLLAPSQPGDDRLKQACLADLVLTYPVDDRAKLVTEKGERVPGTCEWILTHDTYISWLRAPSELLWLSAGPGRGKTMISVFLTQELEEYVQLQQDALLVYYFCDNRDNKRNSAAAIFRGLILQLLRQRPKLFDHILPSYKMQKSSLFTSFESLWRVFEGMVHHTSLTRVFCVVDGLDECDEPSLDMLVGKFKAFFCGSPETLKLLAVSREKPDCLPWALSGFLRIRLAPDLDKQVETDLERFVSFKVDELARKKGYSNHLRTRMVSTLIKRASGTFLWVSFVVADLRNKSVVEVEATLSRLPVGLTGIYDRMLLQISQDHRATVVTILRWVTVAREPLTLKELATAIHIEPVAGLSLEETARQYVSFCGYFLTATGNTVGLVHQSAKDYLLRRGSTNDGRLGCYHVDEKEANAELARACFRYINSGVLAGFVKYINSAAQAGFEDEGFTLGYRQRLDSYMQRLSLLHYASRYWPDHVRQASNSAEDVLDPSHNFCATRSLSRETWCEIYLPEASLMLGFSRQEISDFPLHRASMLGLHELDMRTSFLRPP
jgi:hypothetical protein